MKPKPRKVSARRPRKPPFRVTEPLRYIDGDGWFCHLLWNPKSRALPFSVQIHIADLAYKDIVIANAVKDMLAGLKLTRDELVKAKWLDQHDTIRGLYTTDYLASKSRGSGKGE